MGMAKFVVVAFMAALASRAQADAGGLRSGAEQEVAEPINATEDAMFAAAFDAAFNSEEHIDDNATLSAEVAVSRCSGKYMGAIEALAPGCLAQCESRGICGALNHAISAYGGKGKKDKKAAERAACHHKSAIACLLDGKHRSKCRSLIGQAGRFGVPTTTKALNKQCR